MRPTVEVLEPRETPARAGIIDTSFGVDGSFSAGPGASLNAVAVQPDGRIVGVGRVVTPGVGDMLVVRLNADGTPDTSFDTDGRLTIDFAGSDDRALSVALMADGRIVVGGIAGGQFAAVRLDATGQFDPTFDTDGRATVAYPNVMDPGPSTFSGMMGIDGDGRVVGIGSITTVLGSTVEVIRLDATGQLDPTFDGDGRVSFGGGVVTNRVTGHAVAVQPDGEIYVVGTTVVGMPGRFQGFTGGFVFRLNADGTSDADFSGNGNLVRANAVAIGADGRVVVGGETAFQQAPITPPGPSNFKASRFTPTGAAAGEFTIDLGADDRVAAVAVAADGRIVLAGGSAADFPVVRLNADGSPDTLFNNALGSESLGRLGGSATAVAFQGSNVLVVGPGALLRLLGEPILDLPSRLAVGGPSAAIYVPDSANIYGASPAATVNGFPGSVRMAVGDVNGDGSEDTILVTGPGTPIRVAVVSGVDHTTFLAAPFDPFGGTFTGGGFATAADLDGDGRVEFAVTPDEGGGPRVALFSVNADGTVASRASFLGIEDANFRGGARAAFGDVNGDGLADLIVAAGFLGGPRTAIYNGTTLLATPARLVNDFFAFTGTDADTLRNGLFVAAGDVTGDGLDDLIFGGGPGGAPRVLVLNGLMVASGDVAGAQAAPVANFFVAGNAADRGGIRVAAKDADGDLRAELIVGSGEGTRSFVRVYRGTSIGGGEPATFQDLDPFNSAVLASGVFVG